MELTEKLAAITPTTEANILRHAPVTHKVITAAERNAIMGPAESQDDSDRVEPGQDDGSQCPF